MAKRKKSNSISQNIKAIEDTLPSLQLIDNIEKRNENINVIGAHVKELKETIKGVRVAVLFLISVIIILLISIVSTTSYNSTLKDSNFEIQDKIKQITKEIFVRDATLDSIMGVTLDSNGYPIYSWIQEDGKPLTYKRLISIRDSATIFRDLLNKVRGVYPIYIDYKIKKIKNGYIVNNEVISPIIDSALLLLPVFRDKIKHNDEYNFNYVSP